MIHSDLRWRKATASGGQGGDCVELANTLGAVRDSKAPNAGIVAADVRSLLSWLKSR
ncbi:DUF397 domain-containing protein [Actinophytocola sediminis]